MPLASHFKFSNSQSPIIDETDHKKMAKIPYANAIGSPRYVMVCCRTDIAHSISVLSRFMVNHGRGHWSGVKWLLGISKGHFILV